MSDTSQSQGDHENAEKSYDIVVNGQSKTVTSDEMTFHEVVFLAYGVQPGDPIKSYRVTYRKAKTLPHEGVMVEGSVVEIKEGTVFSATESNNS